MDDLEQLLGHVGGAVLEILSDPLHDHAKYRMRLVTCQYFMVDVRREDMVQIL